MNYELMLESDWWEVGTHDVHDGNTDVFVTFEDGRRWVATFLTYANIASLTEKNKRTGECLSGQWFWAVDMCLVDEVSRERIREVIDDLIEEECFEQIFKQIQGEKPKH